MNENMSIKADIIDIFSTSYPTENLVKYLQAYPLQAQESAFFGLARAVLTNPDAPPSLKKLAAALENSLDLI